MRDARYLIELARDQGGLSPGVRAPLGFDLVDLIYEAVPEGARPKSLPIQVITRLRDAGALPDHLSDANGFHLVSDRLKETLKPHVLGTEFVPAVVETTKPTALDTDIGGGAVAEGYWWIHCRRLLDAVDWSTSKLALIAAPPARYVDPRSSVRFAAWQTLNLAPIPEHEHLFGILGLKGGRRFLSPQMWSAIKNSGARVRARPMFLDQTLSESEREKLREELRAV